MMHFLMLLTPTSRISVSLFTSCSQASRTFSDLNQYPVFPWVISDYTSDVLGMYVCMAILFLCSFIILRKIAI